MEGMVVWLVRERRGEKKGTKRDSGRQCTISSKKASEYRRKRNRPGLGAQEKLPYRNVSRILLSCRISRHSPRFGSHFGLILGPDHTRQQVSGTVSRSAPAPPPAVPYRRASRPRRAGSIGSADRSAAPGGRLSRRAGSCGRRSCRSVRRLPLPARWRSGARRASRRTA